MSPQHLLQATLPDANLRYQEALDRRKPWRRTKGLGGCTQAELPSSSSSLVRGVLIDSELSHDGFEYFWEFWVWVKLDLGLGITRVSGFHDSSIELCLQKGTLLPPRRKQEDKWKQVSICPSREGLWKVNLILRKQPFDFPSPKC